MSAICRAPAKRLPPPLSLVCLSLLLAACSAEDPDVPAVAGDPCRNSGTPGATATCMKPTRPQAWYIDQSSRYFDTLDVSADPESAPQYADLVARWEWPPWLLLTGYTRETMLSTGKMLKKMDPSTVPTRECRAFDVQPFGRCYVVFQYKGGACAIYEEFTFNEAGEMTFIEAWSDLPGLTPITDPTDRWAERTDIHRLATRVPGLGQGDGRLDLQSPWMQQAAANDKDIAELAKRAQDQWKYWAEELKAAPKDFFAQGCGWPASPPPPPPPSP